IICQKPSRLAYDRPWNVNGVGAKLESRPSSWRLERMTSPGPASCGRISHAGAPSFGTGAHQCAGYPARLASGSEAGDGVTASWCNAAPCCTWQPPMNTPATTALMLATQDMAFMTTMTLAATIDTIDLRPGRTRSTFACSGMRKLSSEGNERLGRLTASGSFPGDESVLHVPSILERSQRLSCRARPAHASASKMAAAMAKPRAAPAPVPPA